MAKLKVYCDRISQPSRAVIIFCKTNKIDFEEVRVDLLEREHQTPRFKEINPMGQVPTIVDGRMKLFESHAILRYLACAFPEVPNHWFPADLTRRAKIDSVLDWHHSNLRRGAAGFTFSTTLAPSLGLPPNPKAVEEFETILTMSLGKIESFWLEEDGKFLLGNSRPSIADLSLVCEIMQLELLDVDAYERILGPHKKVRQWMEDVRAATSPHFEDAHSIIYLAQERFRKRSAAAAVPSKL